MTAHTQEIEEFRDQIEAELGLIFADDRREQVAEALISRCTALGTKPAKYLARLSENHQDEWAEIAALLTVPESYFFRHADHLRAFMEVAVPERMEAHPQDRTLRILSIGCAGGEEPYTLAMTLLQHEKELHGWEFAIRGCDLNPQVLQHARRGVYTNWALRATPPDCKARFFEASGNRHRVQEEVRRCVSFERCNALHLYKAEAAESLDVVFFRNVLIYFSPEAIRAAINSVAHMLAPGGYLFLGPAETLRGISDDFVLRHTHETFYYRRNNAVGALIPYSPMAPVLLPPGSGATIAADPVSESPAMAEIPATTTSWMEEIERSSERIRGLHAGRGTVKAARSPVTPSPSSHRTALDETHQLLSLLSAERYAEVTARVAALPPELQRDADVRLLLALAHLNRREIGEAQRASEAVLQLDSMNSSAHYILGLCREQLQDWSGAAEHDRIAIYLDSSFAMPHLHLALMARKSGDARAARRAFEQANLLLTRESPSRVLMFGGGFTREALCDLCRRELRALRVA